MIDRRSLLAATAAVLAASPAVALPIPAGNRLAFRVSRGGTQIGTHALSFARNGDALTVTVAVDLVVRAGPITLYRYTHNATERWEGERVVGVTARTNANGRAYRVNARRADAGWTIERTAGRLTAPANATPATHWNRAMLDGPLINTQTGDVMRPRVARRGTETVAGASGQQISATRYALSGDATLDTWYSDRLGWVALLARVEDGSEIKYERQ